MKSGIRHFARDKSLIVQDKWISNHAERDVRRGVLRRKTKKRKCYPQEIPEDKMLITFCPQMYHLLWIKFFLISAHLPTLSKKPITGVGVKSNNFFHIPAFFPLFPLCLASFGRLRVLRPVLGTQNRRLYSNT